MAYNPQNQSALHPRNIHKLGYDFPSLQKANPILANFIQTKHGQLSIDFSNPQAVKALNQSLLIAHYGVKKWDLPDGHLCPPIPGRADYIHYLADLLKKDQSKIPKGPQIKILDIGTGASAIYPILGHHLYKWQFVASDVSASSLKSATANTSHIDKAAIELRLQHNAASIFNGVMKGDELYDATMCNPPFYSSIEEAEFTRAKKNKALGIKIHQTNFEGTDNELWFPGGEVAFIQLMMKESKKFSTSCFWFTSLVSNQAHLPLLQKSLNQLDVTQSQIIDMSQGNKKSRFIAWTFLNPKQQKVWASTRWT